MVAVGLTVCVPPLPGNVKVLLSKLSVIVTLLEFLAVTERLLDCPAVIAAGLAAMVTVGAAVVVTVGGADPVVDDATPPHPLMAVIRNNPARGPRIRHSGRLPKRGECSVTTKSEESREDGVASSNSKCQEHWIERMADKTDPVFAADLR